jgi:hypothetical protein
MFDTAAALERIKSAEHDTPLCPCGAPTVPVGRDDGIWLVCSNLHRWETRRTFRLLAALFPHVERPIVDGTPVAA